MEYRKYRDTDTKVSLLGFGGMRLPMKGKEIDEDAVQEMVDYAIAHGVNYFDTAYGYHDGQSELVLGRALKKHPRDSFYIATKLHPAYLKEEGDVERVFEDQLKKLQVDYFDFYLHHNMSSSSLPTFEKWNAYDCLAAKKKEGVIKRLGFSFHDSPRVLAGLVEKYAWDFAQIQLNYLDWEDQDAKTQYEILHKAGIPVVVMEPVRGGSLIHLSEQSNAVLKKADPQAGVASWALRFAASLEGVLTVLSGMSNLEQLKENVATMSDFRPFSPADYKVVEDAVTAYKLNATIPCTGCRYCMDCPSGVNIPRIISLYNHYKNNKSAFLFQMHYRELGEGAQAHRCVECGRCVDQCPQAIDIPGWMKKIAREAEELAAENA